MAGSTIRVLIADDHEVVRQSLVAMLSEAADIEVVGTAVDGQEAVELAQVHQPDVVVMDVSMPRLDGIRAAGQIKALGIPTAVIILSMHYNPVLVQEARKKGVAAYLVKQEANSGLIPAIRAVCQQPASS